MLSGSTEILLCPRSSILSADNWPTSSGMEASALSARISFSSEGIVQTEAGISVIPCFQKLSVRDCGAIPVSAAKRFHVDQYRLYVRVHAEEFILHQPSQGMRTLEGH